MNTLPIVIIDTDNILRINESRGGYTEYLEVPLVEEALFRFRLVDENKNPVSFGDGVWEFGIDNSTNITAAALVYATGAAFNAGNWSDESYTLGKVSVVANVHTNEMVEALEDEEADTEQTSISAIAELWFTPTGGTRTLVGRFDVSIENNVLDGSSPVPGTSTRAVGVNASGTVTSPANLWEANATGIYDAIEDLIGDTGGDDLGNHTATQNLNMAGYSVTGIGGMSASSYTGDVSNTTVNTGNWNGNLLGVAGTVKAAFDAIDNMTLGDNLGNHTATQNLNMAGFEINSAGNVNGNTGNFSTLLGQASNITALGSAPFTGNFVNIESSTELKYYLDAIDALPIGQGGGGTVSQLKLSAPFNYMNLSKCFTTGQIGWTAEEEDINYCYSAGGYETSASGLHSGTAWLDLVVPYGATGFAPTGCVDITFVADTGNSALNKLDITFLTSNGNMTSNSTRFTTGSWCPTGVGVPQVFSLNESELLNSSLSGHSRAKFKIEWYSASGYSVKMIGGSINFVG